MESTELAIYTVDGKEFELQHYGVKGMKWGVRKARDEYKKLDQLKGQYKHAKKAYGRSFSYAYNRSSGAYSLNRAKRAENMARWQDATRDANRVNKAKQKYKEQKAAVRKNAPVAAKLERGARAVGRSLAVVGGIVAADYVYTGGKGTKAATAAVKNVLNKVGDQVFDYAVLDKAGKVIRRYN